MNKYLKYKRRYIKLKKAVGGADEVAETLDVNEVKRFRFDRRGWEDPAVRGLVMFRNSNTGFLNLAFSYDKYIIICDPFTEAIFYTLTGHTALINCLSLISLKNGECLVSGSADNTIKIWDPLNGTLMYDINHNVDSVVESFTFFRDFRHSPYLGSGLSNGTIKVWNLEKTPTLLRTIKIHNSSVNALGNLIQTDETSEKEKLFIVSGSTDRTVKISEYSKKSQSTVHEMNSTVLCLEVFDEGGLNYIVAGLHSGEIKIIGPETTLTISGVQPVLCLKVFTSLEGSTLLASGCYDRRIRIWDIDSQSLLVTLTIERIPKSMTVFKINDELGWWYALIVGDNYGTITIFRLPAPPDETMRSALKS